MVVYRANVDPSLLKKEFRIDIHKLLDGSPFTWLVTFGFRSLQEQEKLWQIYRKGGPKAAPPGKSAHNYGLAVDVVPDGDDTKPGIQPDWTHEDKDNVEWLWLFDAVWKHPRLHSGRSFQDASHIERLGWKQYI